MNMTITSLILCISFTLSSNCFAQKRPKTQKVNSATLNVDGEFANNDEELSFLQNELKNVKGLKSGYKKKSKVFSKLTTQSEELKENFENYIENRIDYEKAIGDYNKTIACLKNGDPLKCRPDLAKRHRRSQRKSQRRVVRQRSQDSVRTSMAAPRRVARTNSKDSLKNFIRDVDLLVAQKDGELLSCYRAGRYSQQGVLKVQLKISSNGNLGHLGFEDITQVNDPRVIRCVSKVLYSINYPATPDGRTKTIRKPFIFNLM